jgi:hypothetical protein
MLTKYVEHCSLLATDHADQDCDMTKQNAASCSVTLTARVLCKNLFSCNMLLRAMKVAGHILNHS